MQLLSYCCVVIHACEHLLLREKADESKSSYTKGLKEKIWKRKHKSLMIIEIQEKEP